jgi:acyl carrier protein
MEDRIKKIFVQVFDIKLSDINNDSSPANIEAWDSYSHSNLILALEEEFNVLFTPDEIIELLKFDLIKSTLQRKLTL